jgi:ketosteroid isomerase-like protein
MRQAQNQKEISMTYRYLAFGLLIWGVFCPGSVSAQAPDPQVMAPIEKFVTAFNKGDVAGAEATHAAGADLVILDEVPPFLWRGPQAFKTWAGSLDAYAKQHGHTDQQVTLSKPTRVEMDGDNAYVVVPAAFTYKEKGVDMRSSSQMTLVLKKGASGWLIHGWTWTGPRPQKAASKPSASK